MTKQCDTLLPFGSYPDPWGITEADRAQFAPVVIASTEWKVQDFTRPSPTVQLLSLEQLDNMRQQSKETTVVHDVPFAIGRYDEDRVGMYESDLFIAEGNRRTLHVGIDLGGPVNTPVYAFADGTVVHVGYNAAHGDYGNVVVIQHQADMYALYGHLSASVQGIGHAVTKGQVIGHIGNPLENGGWTSPHVHFQLSTRCPETHDMPGAVTMAQRKEALELYPDPRIVLGALY